MKRILSYVLSAVIVNIVLLNYSSLQAFTYTYDSLNRLTNIIYSDGSHESYSYDSSGNRLTRTTLAASTRLDATPPSIPTNLVLATSSPNQLSFVWDRAVDAGGSGMAGYQIYVNGLLVATTTSTNYLLTGLAPNSSYCISIAAVDHYNNVSTQSVSFCTNTAAVLIPLLFPLRFLGENFQIGFSGGTPGIYDILVSTQLPQWNVYTNLTLPTSSNIFIDPATGFSQRFYQLRWSTNTP